MSHLLINQDSGNTEYYTPIEIVNSARIVMGRIDLDPASSEIANSKIQAVKYFTQSDNCLKKDWIGNVWMNHPFSRDNNYSFIRKFVSEFEKGNMTQGCCITFAATSERWFQPLFKGTQCFLAPRTNYYLPNGTKKTGVTKGSVVTYFGNNVDSFIKEFSKHGHCK